MPTDLPTVVKPRLALYFNPNIFYMKKFILFFVIILFFSPYLKSQNCEDCERTTVYDTKTIVLCTFNSGMQLRPRYIPPLPNGVQEYDLEVITGPCVFVIVDYAIVRC
jgi:hypothetical protein